MNRWFFHVHKQGKTFVANTLSEIDEVFPDAKLIGQLGCGSVVNLPVVLSGKLVATINILHRKQHYTPARVHHCNNDLSGPAHRAVLRAQAFGH